MGYKVAKPWRSMLNASLMRYWLVSVTGRTFMRTAGLVLRFKTYGALLSERWPTRLDLRMPFFYLRKQGFWQGFTLEMTEAQSPET